MYGESAGDSFRWLAVQSADGNIIIIGPTGGRRSHPGYAKVYDIEGEGSDPRWKKLAGTIEGEADGDEMGHMLSLPEAGDALAVGSNHNDGTGGDSGSARLYYIFGYDSRRARLETARP